MDRPRASSSGAATATRIERRPGTRRPGEDYSFIHSTARWKKKAQKVRTQGRGGEKKSGPTWRPGPAPRALFLPPPALVPRTAASFLCLLPPASPPLSAFCLRFLPEFLFLTLLCQSYKVVIEPCCLVFFRWWLAVWRPSASCRGASELSRTAVSEMARFQEFVVRNVQRAAGADVCHADAMNLPADERVPKARKPYTISKQREKWTEDEHKLFLESLQLHGRAWRRIQEHIGSKTAVQIRSHAQKFFSKVTRESSGDGNGVATAPQIRIPPPRPKRKPAHPYPRKLGNSPGKDAPVLKKLDNVMLQAESSYEQENVSPKSVLTAAQVGSETLASDSVRSPASSVDVEVSCHAPRIAAVEVATQLPPCKVANGATVPKNLMCGIPESPVLRLFGRRVVVNDLHQQPNSSTENEQNEADMELDESAGTPTSGTGKLSSHSAVEANTLNPWLTNTNQFMYYLPRGKVLYVPSDCQFFSYNDGSIACTVLNPQAKEEQNQLSQAADCRFTSGEGSCSESITTSSSMPETPTQNSDSVESMQVTNDTEDGVLPVPGSRKCMNPYPDCHRGFVPYKKCTAESKMVESQMPGEEADREMTRLCL